MTVLDDSVIISNISWIFIQHIAIVMLEKLLSILISCSEFWMFLLGIHRQCLTNLYGMSWPITAVEALLNISVVWTEPRTCGYKANFITTGPLATETNSITTRPRTKMSQHNTTVNELQLNLFASNSQGTGNFFGHRESWRQRKERGERERGTVERPKCMFNMRDVRDREYPQTVITKQSRSQGFKIENISCRRWFSASIRNAMKFL